MIIKSISKFLYTIDTNNYEEKCKELWDIDPDTCMKCIMFILDQIKNDDVFVLCFLWVYKYHRSSFNKNVSLIIGLPNEKLLTNEELISIAKKDYDEHEKILEQFVSNEYRETFRNEFISRVRHLYFKERLPIYGTVDVLKKIQSIIKNMYPSDYLTINMIEHLCNQPTQTNSIRYKTFDEQFLWIRS